MQFEKDLRSIHQALFLQARNFLLSIEGMVESKQERITTYGNDQGGIYERSLWHPQGIWQANPGPLFGGVAS